MPVCFDNSIYLTDKYFDIVCGCHPSGDPQMDPPKIKFSNSSSSAGSLNWYQRILNRKIFWRSLGVPPPPPGIPPNAPPQKWIVWTAWLKVPVCFDVSRYLTDKYFDIVCGCHPPNGPPKSIFGITQARPAVCIDISKYLTDKYFGVLWECHPPGSPQMHPPKNEFLNGLTLGASVLWYQQIFNKQIF